MDCDGTKALLGDEEISQVPLLILANKIDKCGSAGEDEIRHYFNLHVLTTGKVVSPCFSCCLAAATAGEGFTQCSSVCQSVRSSVALITRGQSNLTKSTSRGAHSPVRGHPRGSKVVPLNSWGRVSY